MGTLTVSNRIIEIKDGKRPIRSFSSFSTASVGGEWVQ